MQNILDTDLATVPTEQPLIKAGLYDLLIKEAKVEDNTDTGSTSLVLELHTTTPVETVTGETIPPGGFGSILFHYTGLKTTEKYTNDAIARNVGAIVQAVGNVAGLTLNNIRDTAKTMSGRIVRCKVSVGKERTDKKTGKTYAPRNEIDAFTKAV